MLFVGVAGSWVKCFSFIYSSIILIKNPTTMVGLCDTIKGPQLVPSTQQTVHRIADRNYAHIPILNTPAVQEPSFLPTK